MKHRKLRIAWSVAWGIVAMLLIGLWWQSFYLCYAIHGTTATPIIASAVRGVVQAGTTDTSQYRTGWGPGWGLIRFSPDMVSQQFANKPSWALSVENNSRSVSVPLWSLTAFAAVISVAPWLRWRFSLRTLLIATTAVAVGLGLIVWLARS